ncbi:hypothetical protein [Limnobacter sp. 130]|uniref:hypothetical protein n=1 Tax=Limnobacter sp. 130 TaxID=2653147 RepID=UPI001358640D|nr:hypothetical protein [Limnobacter sp. 130]
MKILVYKRTHIGDPDVKGRFGINDCMGTIRNFDFDAVIGVGGTGKEPQSFGIDRKLNWIGINPMRQQGSRRGRASIVTFKKFALFEDRGPLLHSLAPNLAKRMYAGRRFIFKSMNTAERTEALELLKLVDGFYSASPDESVIKSSFFCKPSGCKRKRRAKRCG